MPPIPPLSQQLKESKRKYIQAVKAYNAAMDLLERAKAAVVTAEHTVDQALSVQIAAKQDLEATFDAFKNAPDEDVAPPA